MIHSGGEYIIKILLTILFLFSFAAVSGASEPEKFIIKIEGVNYEAEFESNITAQEIVKHFPLTMSMKRYADHEYFAEFPFRPTFAEERTSHLKAGHIYYWDGWNSFVINYEDYDITPYKVVHIGTVTDASGICKALRDAGEMIDVSTEVKR